MWREPQAGARKGKRIRRPPGTTHSEIVHAPLQGRRRPARRPPPFLVQCLFATFHSVVSAASACCAVPALLSFPASVVRRPSLASPRRASLSYIIPHSFLVLLTASFPYFFSLSLDKRGVSSSFLFGAVCLARGSTQQRTRDGGGKDLDHHMRGRWMWYARTDLIISLSSMRHLLLRRMALRPRNLIMFYPDKLTRV